MPATERRATGNDRRAHFDLEAFETAFAPLAAELGMRWKLTASARRPRMALFCSQYLHCMADLLHRWRTGELDCEIPLIVSNHRDCRAAGGVLRDSLRVHAGDGSDARRGRGAAA